MLIIFIFFFINLDKGWRLDKFGLKQGGENIKLKILDFLISSNNKEMVMMDASTIMLCFC